ncbi:hypothetical protein ACRB68_51620 [Actinomadura sp. RB68]|uniref:DUF8094 domain-containing protein n=1 Tax=Actinomadura macrotermitis TaxID=2585200 RepID=A0A7K0C2K9_9ACTN|nr:hypothetical protein [Actinomadura macrotermitis]
MAAALLLPIALTAACGGDDRRARPAAMPEIPKPVPEPLTPQVADREFRAYVSNDDVARTTGDERLALSWVVEGQYALTAAEYRKALFEHRPVARYTYGTPKLYVPRLKDAVYPQWFVASVHRTVREGTGQDSKGKDKGKDALMGFVRRSAGEDWKLSLVTEPAPKAKLPKVVVDRDGYATAIAPSDGSLRIRPGSLPSIQATIASEGPNSIATDVMKPGPYTTGIYQQPRRAKRRKDLSLQSVVVVTNYQLFALATEHGNGLVLYALTRNSYLLPKDRNRKDVKPPIPPEVAFLLDGTVKGNEIDMTQTLQFAAFDPVKAKSGEQPKADVVAQGGGYVKASTPPFKSS